MELGRGIGSGDLPPCHPPHLFFFLPYFALLFRFPLLPLPTEAGEPPRPIYLCDPTERRSAWRHAVRTSLTRAARWKPARPRSYAAVGIRPSLLSSVNEQNPSRVREGENRTALACEVTDYCEYVIAPGATFIDKLFCE